MDLRSKGGFKLGATPRQAFVLSLNVGWLTTWERKADQERSVKTFPHDIFVCKYELFWARERMFRCWKIDGFKEDNLHALVCHSTHICLPNVTFEIAPINETAP